MKKYIKPAIRQIVIDIDRNVMLSSSLPSLSSFSVYDEEDEDYFMYDFDLADK